MKRKGRWQGLNKERRELVYKCIELYLEHNNRNTIASIASRRQLLLKKLMNKELEDFQYDHVIVDEFQDCTKADYDIFYNLVKDVNNITLAGDLAQAIHIGKSADIPRDDRMLRRQSFLLEGSYRLPHRVSESIRRLSDVIVQRWNKNEATKEIAPVKNSPPGARPIIVYAATLDGMVKKIKSIYETYKAYDISKISILEKDEFFCSELRKVAIDCETDTTLRIKGLEKECVLWSTRVDIDDEKESYEFVYTILTRTSSILIIALSDSTKNYYKKIINLLDQERLIIWDQETKEKYRFFCEQVEIELINVENE